MLVEEEGGPVQPDRGLARPRAALDADRLLEGRAHEVVLLGLDGRHDVAHRPDVRPLDLGPQRRRRDGLVRALLEALVLEGGELAAREPEPAAQLQAHRLGPAGPVERPGHRRPPVDDDRGAGRIVDVAAADVEALAAGAVVEPAEEQRGVRQVLERFGPVVELGLQVLLGDRVTAQRVERQYVVAHEREVLAGLEQVGPFGLKDVGR
jgi:hypothetical protein